MEKPSEDAMRVAQQIIDSIVRQVMEGKRTVSSAARALGTSEDDVRARVKEMESRGTLQAKGRP